MKHRTQKQSPQWLSLWPWLRGCLLVLLLCLLDTGRARADINNAGSYVKIVHTLTISEPYITLEYPYYDDKGTDDAIKNLEFYVGDGNQEWLVAKLTRCVDNLTRFNEGVGIARLSWRQGGDNSPRKAQMSFYPNNNWNTNQLKNFHFRLRAQWDIDDDWDWDWYWVDETRTTNNNNLQDYSISSEEAQFQRNEPKAIVSTVNNVQTYSDWLAKYCYCSNNSTTRPGAIPYAEDYGWTGTGTTITYKLKNDFDDTQTYTIYYYKYLTHNIKLDRGSLVGSYPGDPSVYQLIAGNLRSATVKGFMYPDNLRIEGNKFTQSVELKWTNVNNDSNHNTNGVYKIFRQREGDTQIKVLAEKDKSVTSYTDTNLEVGKQYTYWVAFVPNEFTKKDTPYENTKLTQKKSITLGNTYTFSKIETAVTTKGDGGIIISWEPEDYYQARQADVTLQKYNNVSKSWNDLYTGTNTTYTDRDIEAWGSYEYRLKTSYWGRDFYSSTFGTTYTQMTTVSEIKASQGLYANLVKVSWTADQLGQAQTRFVVSRKSIGESDATYKDIYETLGTASSYYFEDVSAQPGQYYMYKVVPYAKDPQNTWRNGSSKTDEGFTLARGIISGRVTFGSGTAVDSVTVRLVKNQEDEEEAAQFYALASKNQYGVMSWQPTDTLALQNKPFSVQMWVSADADYAPSSQKRAIFSIQDQVELLLQGSATDGQLTLVARLPESETTTSEHETQLRFGTEQYNHVTLTSDGNGQYVIVLNGNVNDQVTLTAQPVNWIVDNGETRSLRTVTLGGNGNEAETFKGYVDDVRFWNKQLTAKEVVGTMDRILAGTESGLYCYWPMDEGLDQLVHVYDYSKNNGIPNGNHATRADGSVVSEYVPGENQLSLYNITDSQGNYVIRGIPFAGDGTNYIVKPFKGVHSFNPTYHTRYISSSSLTHTGVDFDDVSSFKVEGRLNYRGTTIPVAGAIVSVDGSVASKNGEVIQTDENGKFSVDVPIGEHFISLKLDGHEISNNGRWPADPNNVGVTYNFIKEESGIQFFDETLVTVAGRVVGGDIEDEKPLGMGLSQATIGQATILLDFEGNQQYWINAEQVTSGLSTYFEQSNEDRTFEKATSAVDCEGYVQAKTNAIVVKTDPKTGEWALRLPPLQYTVASVSTRSCPEEYFTNHPLIDASTVQMVYTDSATIQTFQNGEPVERMEYFDYVASSRIKYKSAARLSVVEEDHEDGAFGMPEIEVADINGNKEMVKLYTVGEDNQINYTFGHPIYKQIRTYTYNIAGYEEYVNLDDDVDDDRRLSRVPLADKEVNIINEFCTEAFIKVDGSFVSVDQQQCVLDENGKAQYRFKAGMPNINADDEYTRGINISMIPGEGSDPVQWEGNSPMFATVLGFLPTGNNFVTQGPDKVMMILRDPPGSSSSTTYASGSTYSWSDATTVTAGEEVGFDWNTSFGLGLLTWVGVGGGTITELDSDVDFGKGITETYEHVDEKTISHSVTFTKEYSTSSEPDFVGAVGDVFIGASTNLLIGASNDVVIKKDEVTGKYELKVVKNMVCDQEFATDFQYTANYIENVLLPTLEESRDTLLLQVADVKTVRRPATGTEPIYVTQLNRLDPTYGKSNDDVTAFGADANERWNSISTEAEFKKSGRWDGPSYSIIFPEDYVFNGFSDRIKWFNSSVELWKKRLADNEEAKVKAIADPKKYNSKNYSFDAGSSITVTFDSVYVSDTVRTNGFDLNLHFSEGWGMDVKSGSHTAQDFELHEEVHAGGSWTHNGTDEKQYVMSYTLAESGDDDYLSVDVFNAPDNFGPIFSTRGGATSAPYEDLVINKYYDTDHVHILQQKTLQIEKPELRVIDKEVAGVPAGKNATFKVKLYNNSETGEDVIYNLKMLSTGNSEGAQISMDGTSLAYGVDILIPAGEPLTKTLVFTQSDPDVLSYRGITLRLASISQPDDTGVFPGIYSDDSVSVFFQPSCSDIELAASSTIYNQENVKLGKKITLSMSGYDYNQATFKFIRLEKKGDNEPYFSTVKEYCKDAADLDNHPERSLFTALTGTAKLNYSLDLSGNAYSDQGYAFRAVTVGIRNGEEVTNQSQEIRIIRDIHAPQLITMPTPSNGLLTANDNITLTFNEDISNNTLTDLKNFIVTGLKNEAKIDHNVALNLSASAAARTESTIDLADKSFSTCFWLNYSHDGLLLQHGTTGNSFTAAIAAGKLVLSMGDTQLTSAVTLPKDKWIYMALCYDNSGLKPTLSAGYASGSVATPVILFDNVEALPYEGNGPLMLGGNNLTGYIQELSLWNKEVALIDALSDKDYSKNPFTTGLIGYWPLTEGHGIVAADKARSRHLTVPATGAWYIAGSTNYVLTLDGQTTISVPAGVNTLTDDSYLVETWFSAAKGASGESTIFANHNKLDLRLSATGALELGINGNYTNAYSSQSLYDGQWHHVALNVLKGTGGSAVLYLDGNAVRQFAASNMPQLNGDFTIGGIKAADGTYKQKLKGQADEFRIWKGNRTARVIEANMYQHADTCAAGLIAYYPLEKRTLSNSAITTVRNLGDQAGNGLDIKALTGTLKVETATSLSLTNAAEKENVNFNFVASERQITIQFTEPAYNIENCNVDIVVREVEDRNGNACDPITWTVFVQQNQLKWLESEVCIVTTSGQSENFSVEIENTGSSTEAWTLMDMPSWLSVNAESGILTPHATQRLRFSIEPTLAVGNYEAVIYLTGSQQLEAPLCISLKVKGEVPDWNPVPDMESMIIVGQLMIDDKLCADPDDMIAAFYGQKCVGMAHPEYSARYDAYFVSMNVYGNLEMENARLQYKVYDASTGKVYPSVSASRAAAYKFNSSAFVGTFKDPTLFTTEDKIEQELTMERAGWKWFSMYVTPDVNTVADIFADVTDKVSIVKSGHQSSISTGMDWMGTLDELSLNTMYKLQANDAFQETTIGRPANPSEVDIHLHRDGWSWIGYPVAATNSVTEAFAGASPEEGDIVKSQSQFAMYMDGDWIGSLKAMTPGEGYKYLSNATADKVIHFQTPVVSARRARSLAGTTNALMLTAEENMSLMAILTDNGQVIDDADIYVYAGEELCGYSAADDDAALHFVTIGNLGRGYALTFVVKRGDEEYVVRAGFDFKADTVVGSPDQPYVIELAEALGTESLHVGKAIERIEYYDAAGILLHAEDRPASMLQATDVIKNHVALQRVIYDDGMVSVFKVMNK